MTTLTQASRQWATRPADQRFTSLTELNDFASEQRRISRARVVSSRAVMALPVEGEDPFALQVEVEGEQFAPTNFAFGQLASLAGAPAGYLRDLPAALAADNINYGLQVNRDVEDVGLLSAKNGGDPLLRAATGPNYGRIWNEQITGALVRRFGDGLTGDFRVPGEFGKAVTVTKANTTLYASDRDMFVFLADETNRIEIKNRRDGKSGSLARGFFLANSEVGDKNLWLAQFLFDYACSNRMVWGAQEFSEIKIRHSAGAPDRWLEQVMPTIEAYVNAPALPLEQKLAAAQATRVEKVAEFLRARKFTQKATTAMIATHLEEEGRPIESLWDVSTAITAYARRLPYQNERVEFEREAGKVLALAA